MNPNIATLHPYPFEKLANLLQGVTPVGGHSINLSIGEPQHASPQFILDALSTHLHSANKYPFTKGDLRLRQTLCCWIAARFQIPAAFLDPELHVLPVNGSREGLFSIAQAVINRDKQPLVVMPNPFYQIYEGAALLAGAQPYFFNTSAETAYLPQFNAISAAIWQKCQMVYLCTPGNPTGMNLPMGELQALIQLADRYGFVIVSDECYSEIYPPQATPPAGLLQAAVAMGNTEFKHCIVFNSLSKRSNIPGLRSGFAAGHADIIRKYQHYRTYLGNAMAPPIQAASIAAWQDENHADENRRLYQEKFAAILPLLKNHFEMDQPDAGFYLWPKTPGDDESFAKALYARHNVKLLPGSYLARHAHGINPGHRRVRIALVAPLQDCITAAERMIEFVRLS